jgi:hypothetical protein
LGELPGIPVIDFVIIGEAGRYWSSGGRGVVAPAAALEHRNVRR